MIRERAGKTAAQDGKQLSRASPSSVSPLAGDAARHLPPLGEGQSMRPGNGSLSRLPRHNGILSATPRGLLPAGCSDVSSCHLERSAAESKDLFSTWGGSEPVQSRESPSGAVGRAARRHLPRRGRQGSALCPDPSRRRFPPSDVDSPAELKYIGLQRFSAERFRTNLRIE